MPAVTNGITELTYNDVVFGPLRHSEYSFKVEWDAARRAVKLIRVSITVRGVVEAADGENTDPDMRDLLKRLTARGAALIVTGLGIGSFRVNSLSGPRDVDFGPRPELVDVSPMGGSPDGGGGPSIVVTWKCSTAIPLCDDAVYEMELMEFNYEIDNGFEDGYATIATTGHIEIPMTVMVGRRSLPDHVDAYRERIQTPVPLGFNRESPSFKINAAKTRCNFFWRDVQLRTAPPQNCTHARVSHEVDLAGPDFARGVNTISGTLTVPPNFAKVDIFKSVLAIIMDRWFTAPTLGADGRPRALPGPRVGPLGPGQTRPTGNEFPAILPQRLRVNNHLSDGTVDFSFTYRHIWRATVFSAPLGLGVWRGYPGTSWEKWRGSMERLKVFDVRGPASVVFRKEDDVVIDLCHRQPKGTKPTFKLLEGRIPDVDEGGSDRRRGSTPGAAPDPGQPPELRNGAFFPVSESGRDQGADEAGLEYLPRPEESWLRYDVQLTYLEERGRYARHQPLRATIRDGVGPDAAGGAEALRLAEGAPPSSATTNAAGRRFFRKSARRGRRCCSRAWPSGSAAPSPCRDCWPCGGAAPC